MANLIEPVNYKQHELKPLGGGYIPSNWLFLDTETRERKKEGVVSHFFYVGWTCVWVRSGKTGRGVFKWVYHEKEKLFNRYLESEAIRLGDIIITAHNVFFDLQASGFYEYFSKKGWFLDFYYDQGLTYILKCRKEGVKITVISTTNWFDQSLKKLGDNLGLKKYDIDFKHCSPFELKQYCRRDVEIIVKAVKQYINFIKIHDLGKLSLTKASQAFTAYRHRFMTHKIMIHDNIEVQSLERSAYTGGRVECFRIGKISGGPFKTMDVNAMYPFVMATHEYPYKLISYRENQDPAGYLDILKTYAVIAEIEVNTPLAVYAVKHKGKTVFPTGQFTCFVCSTGLQFALELGHVTRIIRAIIYRRADLFRGYVQYFHDLRLRYKNQGNDIMLLLCKYMHNSLYGKFGQLKIVTDISEADTGRDYYREDVFNMVTGHNVVITTMMNRQLVQYPEGEGDNSNVAIAAHITENARFLLWHIMNDIGRSRVLYCDTDSIKIRVRDLKHLSWPQHETDLGALKCEDTSNELYIEGAKNYRTEHKRKIKGIPQNAVERNPGVFVFTSFVRQVSHLRNGQPRGAQMRIITRNLRAPYSKGVVLPSGKVRALRFPAERLP